MAYWDPKSEISLRFVKYADGGSTNCGEWEMAYWDPKSEILLAICFLLLLLLLLQLLGQVAVALVAMAAGTFILMKEKSLPSSQKPALRMQGNKFVNEPTHKTPGLFVAPCFCQRFVAR